MLRMDIIFPGSARDSSNAKSVRLEVLESSLTILSLRSVRNGLKPMAVRMLRERRPWILKRDMFVSNARWYCRCPLICEKKIYSKRNSI
jgi:hypothetical protein